MTPSDLSAALANDIRAVDGDHDLGAAELAARLVERGWSLSDPLPAATEDGLRQAAQEVYDFARGSLIGPPSAHDEALRKLAVALARSTPPGLDVETLAKALHHAYDCRPLIGVDPPGVECGLMHLHVEEAERLAAEYARLTQPAEKTP